MAYNIVLIAGGYYPNFSATGNCIRQIANCYVSKGHTVYMISRSPDGNETIEDFEGQHIYRVTSKRTKAVIRNNAAKKNLIGKIKVTLSKSYWATKKLLTSSIAAD